MKRYVIATLLLAAPAAAANPKLADSTSGANGVLGFELCYNDATLTSGRFKFAAPAMPCFAQQ